MKRGDEKEIYLFASVTNSGCIAKVYQTTFNKVTFFYYIFYFFLNFYILIIIL